MNIDKRFDKLFLVYAVTAQLEVFVSGFVYNFTSNFEDDDLMEFVKNNKDFLAASLSDYADMISKF